MRLTKALPILLATSANAFTPSHPPCSRSTQLQAMADLPPQTSKPKVLTASDVIAKSAAGTANAEEDIPKLFTEEIYGDFQSALLKLEKRVKEGRGSLSGGEVREFEAETGRIVEEMNAYLKDPEGMKNKIAAGYASGSAAATPALSASTTHTIKSAMPSPPVASNPPPAAVAPPTQQAPPQPQLAKSSNDNQSGYGVTDISNDDGPAYDGQGGFGLARGTTNTYVIPGMDEMSPEEYRQKLQESISARQAKRREEAIKSGVIGNRSSNGYLETLGQQGEIELDANDNEVLPSQKKGWRSDSVRSWMEALGRVEREIESNLEFEGELTMGAAETDDTEEAAKISMQQREIAAIIAKKQQQEEKEEPSSKRSIEQQPESVIDFASLLKQGKEEKELSRKSEWQTEINMQVKELEQIEIKSGASETSVLKEEKQWFNEKRQRPIPTSDRPQYTKVDKYVGDASKISVSEQRLERGWYNEKRVRPIPNADARQRPTVADRTGTQSDRKSTKTVKSRPTEGGVWYDEKRVRPVPTSDPAERPKITDRTGAQQDRKYIKVVDSQTASDGVWYDEKRARPVPNSDAADRPTVSERTGAQHNRQSSKASDSRLQGKDDGDMWYGEQRVRPAPNSEPAERPKVADRTGAELEVNKKATKSSNVSETRQKVKRGWYNEKRVRPVPNTESPEHPKVYDRTGAELDATPKGPIRNSLLRSLLNDEPPNRTKVAMQTSDKSAASSSASELNQWWKDKINRPKDYAVTSNAPLNNTYEKRREPPKNYGDMKLELSNEDQG